MLIITSLSIFLVSCANRISLTGGPKDELPPVLDTLSSFKNEQTLFVKQKIQLNFNEFIELKSAAKQVVVSPPLNYLPVIVGKGKQVVFDFNEKEILKEEATYVVNFGEAISDYTEGNKIKNFTIVFSTGDYIDSLSMRGTVKDAKSQKPVENYLVMLYDSFFDSIVYQKKPFYFAKTAKDGTFQINNIRADTFKLFVLNDKNLDYIYDPQSEEIGFREELVIIEDTSNIDLNIETFKEEAPPRFLSYEVRNRGLIELLFDRTPDISSLKIIDSIEVDHLFQRANEYSINLWYIDLLRTKMSLEFKTDELKVDTISLRINLRSNTDPDTLLGVDLEKPKSTYGLHPDFPITINTTYPIRSFDTSKILVVDTLSLDTLIVDVTLDSITFRKLFLHYLWQEQSQFSLIMYPGFITDLWGHSHDTITTQVSIAERIDFGSIELNIINLPTDTTYLISIKEKETLVQQFSLNGLDTLIKIEKLPPAEYSIEIIEDINENKKWDPGNYLLKKQSERIFKTIQLEKLKENWILEYEVDISSVKNNLQ